MMRDCSLFYFDSMTRTELFSSPATAAYALAAAQYPSEPPFHPGIAYPEYRLERTGPPNHVYEGVRNLFHLLKLDHANFGTPQWNPLRDLVHPGNKVIIKPNFLWHSHRYKPEEWIQVITHGSVIRAVVDYVLVALNGRGEVWIADGPQLDARWDILLQRTGIGEVIRFCETNSAVPVRLLDLRDCYTDVRGDVTYKRVELPGDPQGSTIVNLGERSRFGDHLGSGRYYGADYDQAETNAHHSGGRHEYRISKTVASADVFINLPKVKTHKKVGVTLCLKNLVGINTGRNWLPHHTDGDPSDGGDQFPAINLKNVSERWGIRRMQQLALRYPHLIAPLFRALKSCATPFFGHTRETVRSGNWHGNDTCWRMVQDINRCLMYSDGEHFPMSQAKRFFAVVDGVIAGDGDGPAAPDPCPSGFLVAGFNPVSVDCATTRLMGFDPMRVAMLREAFQGVELPLAPFRYEDIQVCSNKAEWRGPLTGLAPKDCFRFRPHFGWRGAIEWRDLECPASLKPSSTI
jgi:uncharacterized protein (DUF362 family)